MYAATREANMNWGAQTSSGGPGTTGPPLATTLMGRANLLTLSEQQYFVFDTASQSTKC